MENSREKQIIDTLSNKNQDKLKELNVSKEEAESLLKVIDKKIGKLNSEILEYINNVEREINYTFDEAYKQYLLKHSSLKLEKNILGLANGNEKLVRHFYSMDPNSKIYILKYQSFDSELKDKLVPFAELEFGDTLCFERETNKIIFYNHELDMSTTIADNWNDFIKELYDDNVYKTKNGFEYKYKGMEVIIMSEEINEELTNYGDKIVDFYFESKDKITDFLFQKFERDEWYVKEYTKEQILEKIGKPTIYVDGIDYGSLCYLKSKLDEHLITIELYGLNLDSVSIDG
ncbi:MAG: SMI1/KNR4 family protein [Bacilli bacterium]|nr:SMI1/KNR4 family protein [Bacilli bacterium]